MSKTNVKESQELWGLVLTSVHHCHVALGKSFSLLDHGGIPKLVHSVILAPFPRLSTLASPLPDRSPLSAHFQMLPYSLFHLYLSCLPFSICFKLYRLREVLLTVLIYTYLSLLSFHRTEYQGGCFKCHLVSAVPFLPNLQFMYSANSNAGRGPEICTNAWRVWGVRHCGESV